MDVVDLSKEKLPTMNRHCPSLKEKDTVARPVIRVDAVLFMNIASPVVYILAR